MGAREGAVGIISRLFLAKGFASKITHVVVSRLQFLYGGRLDILIPHRVGCSQQGSLLSPEQEIQEQESGNSRQKL